MVEVAEAIAAAAAAAAMEAVLRPMAILLTGPRPDMVAEPTEEAWGAPSDTCAAATEEEEATDDCTVDTEEGKDEEWRLESPSTLWCCRERRKKIERCI